MWSRVRKHVMYTTTIMGLTTNHVDFIKTLVRREESRACAVVWSAQDDQTKLTPVHEINARRSRIHKTQFNFEVVLTILHENSSQSRARRRIVNPEQSTVTYQ